MDPKLTIFAVLLLLVATPRAAVTEAQVFDWWDAGIITPEQAQEFLDLLEEGNAEEACLLAEVYAQESCEEKQTPRKKAATKDRRQESRPPLRPTGYALTKIRLDSAGHVESHREELRVNFYRYTLRLGTQELLSYRNAGSEAHFGDISTKELHSHIPLDTLWGTALLYPFGNFQLAALLDSSRITQARAGYAFDKHTAASIAYWHGTSTVERHHFHSVALQTSSGIGKASAWYQAKQSSPLIKIELRSPLSRQPVALGWRTTAYNENGNVIRPAVKQPAAVSLNDYPAITLEE